jgi:hypothetical protein
MPTLEVKPRDRPKPEILSYGLEFGTLAIAFPKTRYSMGTLEDANQNHTQGFFLVD